MRPIDDLDALWDDVQRALDSALDRAAATAGEVGITKAEFTASAAAALLMNALATMLAHNEKLSRDQFLSAAGAAYDVGRRADQPTDDDGI